MQSSKMKLMVPYGLRTLLEGVSQAVVESNPKDITQFFALYFQELVTFQKGHPNLELTQLVANFNFVSGSGNHSLEKTAPEFTDTPFSGEPEQQDKSTDTEEDQILEEPDIQHSSKATQQPSTTSCIAEIRCPLGSGGALSPEEAQLAYVPAQLLGNTPPHYSVRHVATSVQTLPQDSQASEDDLTPLDSAAEDAAAGLGAEGAAGSPPAERSRSPAAGEPGPSGSQAEVLTNDVSEASRVPSWEERPPSPPSAPPAPAEPLQAVPPCHRTEGTSPPNTVPQGCQDEPLLEAEAPPYVEQFPQKIVIPFAHQTTHLFRTEQPGGAGQGSSTTAKGGAAAGLVESS